MDQLSFAEAEYVSKHRKTCREQYLEEMEALIPWEAAGVEDQTPLPSE